MKTLFVKSLVILLAAVANLALGFYWYGTQFSHEWSSAAHVSSSTIKHPTTEQFAAAAIGAVLTAIAMSIVGHRLAGTNAGLFKREGVTIIVAAIAWVGFAAATAAKHYAFLGHSQELLALDYGYDLAAMLVTAIVVAMVE